MFTSITENCWYCLLNPKRGECELTWLPDPVKGTDGDFQPLSECYGIDTMDDCRPSIQGKAVPTETDKTNKPYMNSGI